MALQLTFDCVDPHAQVRFWAAALDYDIEDHHDVVGEVIEAGHIPADSDDVIEVDGRRAWRHYSAARSRDTDDRMLFEWVPEGNISEVTVMSEVIQ
jgi:Glyoxalase-like domain